MPLFASFIKYIRALLAISLAAMAFSPYKVFASKQKNEFLGSPEIQHLLHISSKDIIDQTSLDPRHIKKFILKGEDINAMATFDAIAINSSIIETTSAEVLIGVLAHEIGHIVGGDLAARQDFLNNAFKQALVIMGLSALAGIASERGDISISASMMAQHLVEGQFFHFQREEESAADSFAISTLERAKITSRGLIELFEITMKKNESLNQKSNSFSRTHNVDSVRVNLIMEEIKRSPYYNAKLDPEIIFTFAMVRASLVAHLRDDLKIIGKYKEQLSSSDNLKSSEALYAFALMNRRSHKYDEAIKFIDLAIAKNPKYPFFHQIKSEILADMDKMQESIKIMKKAISLSSGLAQSDLKMMLADILIRTRTGENIDKSIRILNRITLEYPESAYAHLVLLSKAYSLKGDVSMSHLANAKRLMLMNEKEKAVFQAKLAIRDLEEGSIEWMQAQDILEMNQ